MQYDPNILPKKEINLATYPSLVICLFTLSCAADLKANNDEEPLMISMVSSELIIDATSSDSWIYFDLDKYLDAPEFIQNSLSDDLNKFSSCIYII